MARYKMCVCGKKSLATRRDLCAGCLDKYGADKKLWPDWVKFAVKDTQDEYNYARNHDDFEAWDNFNYTEQQELPELYKGPKNWEEGDSDNLVDLEAAMAKLEPELLEAFTLYSQGYTHPEIAEQMDVSLRSAKAYTMTARKVLAAYLE